MGMVDYRFENGFILEWQKIDSTVEAVFKTLKNELPKEDKTYRIAEFLLEKCIEQLQNKDICL